MSVDINGSKYFTKEMARVFETEVIECPDCSFEFALKHEQADAKGLYQCPVCKEHQLHHENNQLRGVLEDIAEMKSVGWGSEYIVKRYAEYAKNALNGDFEKKC